MRCVSCLNENVNCSQPCLNHFPPHKLVTISNLCVIDELLNQSTFDTTLLLGHYCYFYLFNWYKTNKREYKRYCARTVEYFKCSVYITLWLVVSVGTCFNSNGQLEDKFGHLMNDFLTMFNILKTTMQQIRSMCL